MSAPNPVAARAAPIKNSLKVLLRDVFMQKLLATFRLRQAGLGAQDNQPAEIRPCLKPSGLAQTTTKSFKLPIIQVASGAPGGAAR